MRAEDRRFHLRMAAAVALFSMTCLGFGIWAGMRIGSFLLHSCP